MKHNYLSNAGRIPSIQSIDSAFITAAIVFRRNSSISKSSYPTRNHSSSIKYDEKNHMQMRKMSSTQISHHASKTNGGAATTTNNDAAHNSCCQYVVSRNGIILPWQQIHQQYRRVVQDDDDDDTNYSSTASSNQQQQQQINNNANINNNTPLDSNKLLQLLPRGAYTTCRTVRGGTHIYQFDYHVRRLANSAKSILGEVQQQQQSDSSSDVDDGRSSDGDEAKERLGDTNHQASTSPLELTSNHPIQHDRQLSSFEITQLNITNVVWEHDMALKCIRNTLREFCNCYGVCLCDDEGGGDDDDKAEEDEKVEFKITLLATWEKKEEKIPSSHDINNSHAAYESVLYCHVGLLQPKKDNAAANTTTTSSSFSSSTKPLQHKRVLVHGHGRENALAKDSKWVLDREKLTKPTLDDDRNEEGGNDEKSDNNEETLHQTPPFEEIILINDDGELLEGTQTNFYVVSGMSIVTANEGILYGSVRDSVLRACRYHNIPVELRPPTLKDLKCASGVFISSTSRWVMPIHEVCLGDLLSLQNDDDNEEEEEEGEERSGSIDMNTNKRSKRNGKSYFYGNCKITENIRRWVLEDVESRSTPLFQTE